MVELTHKRLLAELHYEPKTGAWTRVKTNAPAGYRMPSGYLRIKIAGGRYLAHVLAWFYMTGKWPTHTVDHRDNDNANCRWNNLRKATRTQNRVNCKCRIDNQSGYKGVFWQSKNSWVALIRVRGTLLRVGNYDSPEKAHAAYYRAAKKYFGEFARAA